MKRVCCFIMIFCAHVGRGAEVDFVKEVRPILERRCHECHGAETQKSDFRLDVKGAAFNSGESHAPNIVAGKSGASPLFRFVSGLDAEVRMPPKTRLTGAEVETLRRWIDEGARWPDGVDTGKLEDRTDWWSLKPLVRPRVPTRKGEAAGAALDAFVRAKLSEVGLKPAPEADGRALIRRVYFDLLGLPPAPEEVESFVREHAASGDRAWARLVDRLLASPHYGERWGRHWLDAAHFGETHGYDKDQPRPNAWPYRDYVIRALNSDKPYGRFVREQIAGDVLFPGTADGIAALGLIAAGPWDLIGHKEVPESKTDGKIARHLDRDDMVQNTVGAFCSLTVQCAQCHNHKFDAITQEDYYALQAVFAAVDRTDVEFHEDDRVMGRFVELRRQRASLDAAAGGIERALAAKAGARYEELTRRIEGASRKEPAKAGNARPDFGAHSLVSASQDSAKWFQVDLGEEVAMQRLVLKPCYDDFNRIGAGFGFPVRFKIEVSNDAAFQQDVTLVWQRHDETCMRDFPNPGLQPFAVKIPREDTLRGRYVRVTAVKLAPRRADYIFALAELEVWDAAGGNRAAGKPVTALDSIEAPPRWRRANLTDGIAPEAAAGEEKEQWVREREALLESVADVGTWGELQKHRAGRRQVEAELAGLPPALKVYAGAVHHGSGAFRGTGPDGGRPRVIQVLKRGDVKTPGAVARPGAVAAISRLSGLPEVFAGAEEDGARRAALAEWIASSGNPLTWRSAVNRVWQHHFGRGLVETANDFGRMGGTPSHPELLDWLAVTFRDDLGGSMKGLHRLILMSRTYRQASVIPLGQALAAERMDKENRLLWRQNRRKLDAECVRDSVLAVSGALDPRMGGPSFQDFVIDKPQHSPHYEYHLHDPNDQSAWRRSVYRFIVRSQQQPFMTVLDCADPSMRVDKRNESLSPPQALALMNNGLMVAMAGQFARRVEGEAAGLEARVARAFRLALGREASGEEYARLTEYTRKHGLPNLCRLLMNLNEFAFAD